MKRWYKIEDFIDTTSNAFALKGTSPLTAGAQEVTMCSSSDVLAEIEQSFGERSIYVKETLTPFVDFSAMWARWLRRRGDRLAASWEALHSKYKPLENYDRHEAGSDTRTITPAETTNTTTPAETTTTTTPAETTVTSSPAEVTSTITPAETTTTETPAETTDTRTPTIEHTREDSKYVFNSSEAVPVSSATDTDTAGTEVTARTTDTPATIKNETDSAGTEALTVQTAGSSIMTVQDPETVKTETDAAGTDIFTVQTPGEEVTEYGRHTYGNIGVTSAMDLIRQEMEIDEVDFVYKAIFEFINLYTAYV